MDLVVACALGLALPVPVGEEALGEAGGHHLLQQRRAEAGAPLACKGGVEHRRGVVRAVARRRIRRLERRRDGLQRVPRRSAHKVRVEQRPHLGAGEGAQPVSHEGVEEERGPVGVVPAHVQRRQRLAPLTRRAKQQRLCLLRQPTRLVRHDAAGPQRLAGPQQAERRREGEQHRRGLARLAQHASRGRHEGGEGLGEGGAVRGGDVRDRQPHHV